MSERVPVTVVTGFLGAGKTTLIKGLIEQAKGMRIGLIVNEFGDLGFDGEMLASCLDPDCADDVVELTNGCLCCTVADDFVPALETLLERADRPERIVIETSGLALPQPLIAAFAWPSVKPRVTVDAVVTLVDVPAVAAGRFAHDPAAVEAERRADDNLDHHSPLEELFEDQLKAADLVVLSKVDGVAAEDVARVRALVAAEIREGVAMVSGAAPQVFGIGAAAEADPAARDGHHSHDVDHEHDDFDSRVLSARFASKAAAEAVIAALAADPTILRVKGSVALADRPAPLFVQAVGPRVETWFGRPGMVATGLVVIGTSPMNEAVLAPLGELKAA
ncbi:cobalamin biosynthesis protein CobW [Acuticoccus mangrovi]|uniref:Cobalamin biosynthesis protein CobW n=1 Tax=Acuticoccus mangrovi TaxID=2796142 RepID=A0A934ID42_9HYPH|nr:cobalamin biosynthesis protein CobW [Acuticoccus mangrovi]MBJ3774348.1 cobalamin biosynthesis protein CobW [Acuticoccus mangrovi]